MSERDTPSIRALQTPSLTTTPQQKAVGGPSAFNKSPGAPQSPQVANPAQLQMPEMPMARPLYDYDPADLPPHSKWLLDELARGNKVEGRPPLDRLLPEVMKGKTVSELSAEHKAQKEIERATKFIQANATMTAAEREKLWVETGGDLAQMRQAQMNMGPTLMRYKAQAYQEEIRNRFGEDAAMAIQGPAEEMDINILRNDVVPRLTSEEFDAAYKIYERLLSEQPVPPGQTELDMPSQNLLLASAVFAVIAPTYAAQALQMPFQYMQMERARREALSQRQFETQYGAWEQRMNAADTMLEQARLKDADRFDAEMAVFKEEGLNQREELRQRQITARSLINANTKLTVQDKRDLNTLLQKLYDPKIDADIRSQIREEIKRRAGFDPWTGEAIGPSAFEENLDAKTGETEAKTNLINEQAETEATKRLRMLAQSEADAARAEYYRVQAEILPARLEFDKWEAAESFRLKAAGLEFDMYTEGQSATAKGLEFALDAQKQYSEQASSLEEEAKSLERAAALEMDKGKKDAMLKQVADKRERASKSRAMAESYEDAIERGKNRLMQQTGTGELVLPPKPTSPPKYVAKASSSAGSARERKDMASFLAHAAAERGLPPELAIITALVETDMRNLPGGDRDSVGMFQQRDSWGSRANRLSVQWSTDRFLDAAEKAGQKTSYLWQTGGKKNARTVRLPDTIANLTRKAKESGNMSEYHRMLGIWAQATQVSAFGERYAERIGEARALLGDKDAVSARRSGAADHTPFLAPALNLKSHASAQQALAMIRDNKSSPYFVVRDNKGFQIGDILFLKDKDGWRSLLIEEGHRDGTVTFRAGTKRFRKKPAEITGLEDMEIVRKR